MAALSGAYRSTRESLRTGPTDETTERFRRGFVYTVKKLYSEAAQTYPVRFSKASDWCAWSKGLYTMTRSVEEAMEARRWDEAAQKLAGIREHVHRLHLETGVLRTNDFIHSFWMEAQRNGPDAAVLSRALKRLADAPLSMKAKREARAFRGALRAFETAVSPLIEDKVVSSEEAARLRAATEPFYMAYGIEFE